MEAKEQRDGGVKGINRGKRPVYVCLAVASTSSYTYLYILLSDTHFPQVVKFFCMVFATETLN